MDSNKLLQVAMAMAEKKLGLVGEFLVIWITSSILFKTMLRSKRPAF
jgi:hypothetical protein